MTARKVALSCCLALGYRCECRSASNRKKPQLDDMTRTAVSAKSRTSLGQPARIPSGISVFLNLIATRLVPKLYPGGPSRPRRRRHARLTPADDATAKPPTGGECCLPGSEVCFHQA